MLRGAIFCANTNWRLRWGRRTPSTANLLGDKENKDNIHSDEMITDPNNNSDISPDNIIPTAMEDLSEKDRLEIERVLGEQRKMMLAGFQKTRNGVIMKLATPSAISSISDLLGTEVKQSNEDLAHLIDASVASKFGSNMADMMHTLSKSMADKFEELKEQFSKDIGIGLSYHAQSLG